MRSRSFAASVVFASVVLLGGCSWTETVGYNPYATQESSSSGGSSPPLVSTAASFTPSFEATCPVGSTALVTPFQIIVQPTKPNGEPWDGPSNELRSLGCPSFLANPSEIVTAIRTRVLGVSLGDRVGDALLDQAGTYALDAYSGGLFSTVSRACTRFAAARDLFVMLAERFDQPDVQLTYSSAGQRLESQVFQNATPESLRRIDRQLRALQVPCSALSTPIAVAAVDRDIGTGLTLGLINTNDPIGQVSTSIDSIGVSSACAGFAYVAPENAPSGLVAVGLRVDLPNAGACRAPDATPTPAAAPVQDPSATADSSGNPTPPPTFQAAPFVPPQAAALNCACVPGRVIRVVCRVTNPNASPASVIVRATGTTGVMGRTAAGAQSTTVGPSATADVVIDAPIQGAFFNCTGVGSCGCTATTP